MQRPAHPHCISPPQPPAGCTTCGKEWDSMLRHVLHVPSPRRLIPSKAAEEGLRRLWTGRPAKAAPDPAPSSLLIRWWRVFKDLPASLIHPYFQIKRSATKRRPPRPSNSWPQTLECDGCSTWGSSLRH